MLLPLKISNLTSPGVVICFAACTSGLDSRFSASEYMKVRICDRTTENDMIDHGSYAHN